jgi:hypothetical protein
LIASTLRDLMNCIPLSHRVAAFLSGEGEGGHALKRNPPNKKLNKIMINTQVVWLTNFNLKLTKPVLKWSVPAA